MTASDGMQGCVRASDPAEQPPDGGSGPGGLAYTRAISRRAWKRQRDRASDFASLHAVGPVRDLSSGWLASEAPPASVEMWRQVLPVKGECPNPAVWTGATLAGLFRAVVVTGAWLVALSVAGAPDSVRPGRLTRLRAGVGLLVLVVSVLAGVVVRLVGVSGH